MAEIWKASAKDLLTCAVAAPTGLAAFNVGVTIHNLFQLLIDISNAIIYPIYIIVPVHSVVHNSQY